MDIARSILLDREKGTRLLVTEYRDRLYAVALALCRDPAEAEDLAFRTIERAVSRIELYEERDSFYEWLQIILLNLYRNSVRGKMVRSTVAAGVGQDLEDVAGKLQDGDVESAEKIYAAVDSAILRDAIDRLPEDMKETVILRYFMDMPLKKMAQILSVPVGTVMSRLHYARLALAQRIGAAMKKPAVAMIAAAFVLLGATAAVVVGARLSSTAGTSSGDEATMVPGVTQTTEEPEAAEVTQTTEGTQATEEPEAAASNPAEEASAVSSVPNVPSVSSTTFTKGETIMKKGRAAAAALSAAMIAAAPVSATVLQGASSLERSIALVARDRTHAERGFDTFLARDRDIKEQFLGKFRSDEPKGIVIVFR